MVEQRPVNVACILAWSFHQKKRGGVQKRSKIDMGPYVTVLARNLGVFELYRPEFLEQGPVVESIGVRELRLAGILAPSDPLAWEGPRLGPTELPPPDSEVAT